MKKAWDYKNALKRALDAKRKAEADIWAIIGNDPDTESNPYQAESDLNQSNTVYARLYDGVEVIAVRYDPASDPRLRQWGSAVTLEYDGEYWISGPYKRRLTEQMDGLDLPTGALPLREHDHTSDDEGGTLGTDTVGANQIIAGSVTGAEIASATIQNGNMAANSIDSDQYVDGSIDNEHLANDSVKVNNLNNLITGIGAYVRQISNDTFYSEKVTFSGGSAPTVTDDANAGYILASKWIDSINYAKYFLFSAAPGAALWKRYLFSGDVVPSDTDTLDGASTAIVTQTASDTFDSIKYNHTATSAPTTGDDTGDGYSVGSPWIDVTNDRIYQVTDVTTSNAVWRETSNPTYYYENTSYTGTTTTSGTTALVFLDTTITSTGFDPNKRFEILLKTIISGDTSGDLYQVSVLYNYDNAGSEGFDLFSRVVVFNILVSGLGTYFPFFDIFNASTAAVSWGYSSAYKVRANIRRTGGTGTATVNLDRTSLQVIEV